jgi:4-alpha-glucanotransferase
VWTGADLEDQRTAGMSPNVEGERAVRDRLRQATGAADGAPVEEVVVGAYRALASAPSQVLIATLEDAAGVAQRPNMPGTVDEWPNWSIPLPAPVEDVLDGEQAAAIAAVLGVRGDR